MIDPPLWCWREIWGQLDCPFYISEPDAYVAPFHEVLVFGVAHVLCSWDNFENVFCFRMPITA